MALTPRSMRLRSDYDKLGIRLEKMMSFTLGGCKYSKVDQTSAPVCKRCGFLGQRPICSRKILFKIDYFS